VPPGGSGPFPATAVLDNFNRANTNKIGSNWTGSKSGYRIVSNRLDVGATADIYWAPVRYGAAQEVYVTLAAIDPSGSELGLILKAQSSSGLGKGMLDVLYAPQSRTVQLWTYTPATDWRQVGGSVPVTLLNGDRFGARALADGRVEAYRNGTLIATWNAANWPFNGSGGFLGIFALDAPNAVLDDFGGGSLQLQSSDLWEPLPADKDAPEEFAMLRYKATLWLPSVLAAAD
jgi:hypothetical protein